MQAWPLLAICGLRGRVEHVTLTAPNGDAVSITSRVAFETNEADALVLAVQAGLGVAMLPDFMTRPREDRGTLTRVLPGWTVDRPEVWMQIPRRRRNPAARALAQFLAERLG